MKKKIEILAPAGSFEAMKAAFTAGADAVYIGGEKFGARAYAGNLKQEKMVEAIKYAHLYGKKIYLTVNTLVKQHEMEELYEYILPFYENGLDAVIVQDIGVLSYIAHTFKGLDIHVSTQMTLTMAEGASVLSGYGVTRLVGSRELSLREIKEIREHTNLEIEAFVHGALCYSYSGQCLMSGMIGTRSGNRGRCAQPCRKMYRLETENQKNKDVFLLSPKDMCTIQNIPDLIESGINSFKIEGRMKRSEYAALTASLYKKYTNLYCKLGRNDYEKYVTKHAEEMDRDIKNMMDLYNRGGFSTGYYYTNNGKDMMSMLRPNHSGLFVGKVSKIKKNRAVIKLNENLNPQDVLEIRNQKEEGIYEFTVKEAVSIKAHYEANFKMGSQVEIGQKVYRTKNAELMTQINDKLLNKDNRILVKGYFKGRAGQAVTLRLQSKDMEVCVSGEMAQKAMNRPVSEESIKKQLMKTNETAFSFEELKIDSTNDWFISLKYLNELRRNAFQELYEKTVAVYYRKKPEKTIPVTKNKPNLAEQTVGLCVSVLTKEQLEAALESGDTSIIILSFTILEGANILKLINTIHEKGKKVYLMMPTIFRSKTWEKYLKIAKETDDILYKGSFDGFMIKNMEEVAFFDKIEKGKGTEFVLDYNMYMMNNEAIGFWKKRGIRHFTVPMELNKRELSSLGVYGFDMIVYGHAPLMTSAQCVVKNTTGCQHRTSVYSFMDQSHNRFYGKNICSECYNVFYNGKPLHLYSCLHEVVELGVKNVRLDFTIETKERTKEIISLYAGRLLGRREEKDCVIEYTKGHFKRGIE